MFHFQSLGIGLAPAVMLGGPSKQTHLSAVQNLAHARAEAKEFGQERRIAIKKRAQEYREQSANSLRDHKDR